MTPNLQWQIVENFTTRIQYTPLEDSEIYRGQLKIKITPSIKIMNFLVWQKQTPILSNLLVETCSEFLQKVSCFYNKSSWARVDCF